ncbi:MAG: DUF6671 family protein [Sphingomonas sp.]
MPIRGGTYRDMPIALATMHRKELALAKPFRRQLGAAIVVPPGIDTDTLGTFTGEIPRAGTIVETARAKALLGMNATGLRRGLASEGSFGPHPYIPFVPRCTEVLFFIDQENEVAFYESITTHRTNFQSFVCRAGDDISEFLAATGFPRHAIVVAPEPAVSGMPPVKGITSIDELEKAIAREALVSPDRNVRLTTDMRAHFNPTRMAVIRALGHRLANRLATRCPQCKSPGFGIRAIVRGLPCGWCGAPTELAFAKTIRCAECRFESWTRLRYVLDTAEPGHCQYCNP